MFLKIKEKTYPLEWANPREDSVDIGFTGTTPKDIPSLVSLLINQNQFTLVYDTHEVEYNGYNILAGITFWSHVGYVVATLQKSTL